MGRCVSTLSKSAMRANVDSVQAYPSILATAGTFVDCAFWVAKQVAIGGTTLAVSGIVLVLSLL
jgi:hypothetical protein